MENENKKEKYKESLIFQGSISNSLISTQLLNTTFFLFSFFFVLQLAEIERRRLKYFRHFGVAISKKKKKSCPCHCFTCFIIFAFSCVFSVFLSQCISIRRCCIICCSSFAFSVQRCFKFIEDFCSKYIMKSASELQELMLFLCTPALLFMMVTWMSRGNSRFG